MADWYVKRGEKTVGPISSSKLKELAGSGKLKRTDLIAKSSSGPFKKAERLTGLFPEEEEEEYDEYGFPEQELQSFPSRARQSENYESTYVSSGVEDTGQKKKKNGSRKRQLVMSTVLPPAIFMIIYGVLTAGIVGFVFIMYFALPEEMAGDDNIFADDFLNLPPSLQMIRYAVIGILGVMTVIGGIQFTRLKSHGFVAFCSYVMMVPFLTCCCLVGLPIGIWSVKVLNNPDVAKAFDS